MKFLKWIGTIFGTMFLGMAGGQGKTGGKAPRRFGIPGMAFLASLGDGFQWRDLVFLLLIPVLVMGYGTNSILMAWLGVEWLVRLVYALLLSVPFFLFGWRRGVFAAVLLAIAFQVQAGSLGHVSWFGDILIEDIVRYGILGVLIAFNLFVKKDSRGTR